MGLGTYLEFVRLGQSTEGLLYKLENWANKHLEVVDFIGVGILTPELTEMP
jgi:hypothetical protein